MVLKGVHLAGPAIAAIAWWIVPIVGVSAAIAYGVWLTKFKGKFESQTHRSVDRFQNFQRSFHPQKTEVDPDWAITPKADEP